MNKSKQRKKKITDDNVLFAKNNTHKKEKTKSANPIKKRKIIIICVTSLLVAITAISCCLHFFVFNKKINYYQYFNNFETSNVNEVSCILTFSDGTSVTKYDPVDDLYITYRVYSNSTGDGTLTLYGIASKNKEYCQPMYYKILSTSGDYAIVVKNGANTFLEEDYRVGVIRFRGEGITAPIQITDFTMKYYENSEQFAFVGDYLYCLGTKDEYSSMSNFATFYDYKTTNGLLEVFRLRYAYTADGYYQYLQDDDYLVAYMGNEAHFYNLKTDFMHNGFLENSKKGDYTPFPDFEDSLDEYESNMSVYYLGNGWYSRTSELKKTEPFNGFNVCYTDSSDILTYSRTKTDFYNVKTGKTSDNKAIFRIEGVANKYNRDQYQEYSYYLSNVEVYDDNGNWTYDLPYPDPSAMIKDGYSIVYYSYLPNIDKYKDDTEYYLGYLASTTFCIMDENLNTVYTDTAILPVAFVDDVGVQTASPLYTEVAGNVMIYDKNLNRTDLDKYVNGEYTYVTHYADKNSVISIKNAPGETEEEIIMTYGATKPDGTRILDYEYSEITPYCNGYCLAVKYNEDERIIYRVDDKANKEVINDAIVIGHNTYTFVKDGKFGLKNYAGEVLIDATAKTLDTVDVIMKDGQFVVTYVVAIIEEKCLVYEVK